MVMEDHQEEEARQRYDCGTIEIFKHQINELVVKAKEALHVKAKDKDNEGPTEHCGEGNLIPARTSSVPVSY